MQRDTSLSPIIGSGLAAVAAIALCVQLRRQNDFSDELANERQRFKPATKSKMRAFYAVNPMTVTQERVVIAMVGLPARGKSYTSKAIVRYLQFLGCRTKLFNAGNKRRASTTDSSADFFAASNSEAKAFREKIAMQTLEDLFAWMDSAPSGCCCGIFDATNTTTARRQEVVRRCAQQVPPVKLVFVESICNDKAMLDQNYKMKLHNDDYKDADAAKALADFVERVKAYEQVYESITDEEADNSESQLKYVQTFDAGRKVVACGCSEGFVLTNMVTLLHSINLGHRKLSFILAGESENDRAGIRGGDTPLSSAGLQFSSTVCNLVLAHADREPVVLAGTLLRYIQMVDMLRSKAQMVLNFKSLNELCFGSLEGLPGGRLRHSFPKEHEARAKDKLNYRYPGVGGESYMDLIMQLRDVVLFIERAQADIIVICDIAVARALLGYIRGVPIVEIPDIEVAPGVIELTRSHSGFEPTSITVEEGRAGLLTVPLPVAS